VTDGRTGQNVPMTVSLARRPRWNGRERRTGMRKYIRRAVVFVVTVAGGLVVLTAPAHAYIGLQHCEPLVRR